jgi:TPR repeat protein
MACEVRQADPDGCAARPALANWWRCRSAAFGSLYTMGFCPCCNHAVHPRVDECPECGNRRFCFLTGQVRFDPRFSRVEQIGFKDALIEYIEESGLDEAEDLPERYFELLGPRTGLMEYVDTRAEQTWWERYDEIDFKVNQIRAFAGPGVLDRITNRAKGEWLCDNTALLTARRSPGHRQLVAGKLHGLGGVYGTEGGSVSAPIILAWCKQADHGNAKAQLKVGWTLYTGFGAIPRDVGLAVASFLKAADQGYAPAQCCLGLLYELGEGVPEDFVKAYAWMTLAAEYAPELAREEKESLEQDLTLSQIAEALYFLAIWTEMNESLPWETAQRRAVKWYRKAAQLNHPDAQFQLSGRYATGTGVEEDDAQALAWCKKSADGGYAPAQYELGERYADGQGVSESAEQAIAWIQRAADQGHINAQIRLAKMYANGDGTRKDRVQASFWAQIAAQQGSDCAKQLMDQLEEEMTPSQIAEAGELVRNFVRANPPATGHDRPGLDDGPERSSPR